MADEDTWWEVQAQLVVLASILLGMFPVTDERHEAPMKVLTKLFTTKTYIGVQKAGLSHLAVFSRPFCVESVCRRAFDCSRGRSIAVIVSASNK